VPFEPQLLVLVVSVPSVLQTSPAGQPVIEQSAHLPLLHVSQAGQSPSDRHGGAQCPAVAPGRKVHTSDPEQGWVPGGG
jgi:hypothetical protein